MEPAIEKKQDHYVVIALNLGLLFILLLVLYKTLSVFSGVFTYSIIFSVALFGVFEKLVTLLGARRKIAGLIYGLLLLTVIAVPLIFMISMVSHSIKDFHEFIISIKEHHVPPLPENITNFPIIGEKAKALWAELEKDPNSVVQMYGPQIKYFLQHLISAGGGIMGASLELILGIIISVVVLTIGGKKIIMPLETILVRLTGVKKGMALVDSGGRAIRGVAIGVMGTGFIAAILAWLGYYIAGIHAAALLAAITFFLVVIQVGPLLVVIPVAAFLASKGETGWAIFVGAYGLLVLSSVDNILKPILIARSGKLPVMVLFLGVAGGMAAWGFTGMFKGAIVLALFYTLTQWWVHQRSTEPEKVPEKPPQHPDINPSST